jgi:hypothetical protein
MLSPQEVTGLAYLAQKLAHRVGEFLKHDEPGITRDDYAALMDEAAAEMLGYLDDHDLIDARLVESEVEPEDAGCDACGTNDRALGDTLCADCRADEDDPRPVVTVAGAFSAWCERNNYARSWSEAQPGMGLEVKGRYEAWRVVIRERVPKDMVVSYPLGEEWRDRTSMLTILS